MGGWPACRGRVAVKRGDVFHVSLDPASGHEQSGAWPVVVVSADEFNVATGLPVVLPITTGGAFARRSGFAVPLSGSVTTGVVRCDQPRVMDLAARKARKVDTLAPEVMDEVMARLVTLFQ